MGEFAFLLLLLCALLLRIKSNSEGEAGRTAAEDRHDSEARQSGRNFNQRWKTLPRRSLLAEHWTPGLRFGTMRFRSSISDGNQQSAQKQRSNCRVFRKRKEHKILPLLNFKLEIDK